ncbi:uncharacterized protein LOC129614064 [Condylostylus longicornis]|uniref:uncharacterized protein LOC129614064 n=1 Tax=Condylostylus longicornis TaxID=2530218 RepID=UPI00244DAEAB|nr:uncharacterized protein LOC129614064 [Condylostylus longicornis]
MNEYEKWRQNDTIYKSLIINPLRHNHQHFNKRNNIFLPQSLLTSSTSSSTSSYLTSQLNDSYNNYYERNNLTASKTIEFNALTENLTVNGLTNYHLDNKILNLDFDKTNFHESLIEQNNNNNNNYNEDNEVIQPGSLLFLIIIYGIIILCGVLGNASLVITLFSTSSIRLRNPLLIALCIADLFVSGISAPTTIITLALTQKPSYLSLTGCKVIYYLQSMPTAASTICFLMLSLDRFITVQHPTIAQIRQRRYVHTILAAISWLAASSVCLPFILFYKLTLTSSYRTLMNNREISIINQDDINKDSDEIFLTSTSFNDDNGKDSITKSYIQNYLMCQPEYNSSQIQTSFIVLYTIIVYIFPSLGVLINHYGVRRKLCALSLTARAAHGELPLPMPILRRPTHVIIVTGMANAARGVVSDDDDCSNDEENQINDKNKIRENMVNILNPKTPRSMREVRAQQRRQKQEMKQQKLPAPGLPLPQTSTLRARRRLANMLVAAAIIFVGCWTPHVFCILWSEFGHKQYCNITMSYASLLLGYTHSAINPIIYWILNYNALRQSPCAPFMHITTVQRFFRTHLRPTAPAPPSSTNEAALGAFNPRYIKTTPKQYRAQASSHYLY